MSIASWLLPVLWREQDWRAALERLSLQLASVEAGPQAQRAGVELGRASEYIEPDRRRTIAAYELAGPGGDLGRARELAVEIGWWAARARLTMAARAMDADPRLVLDEVEAWWDAGQPDLAELALAGVRGTEYAERIGELRGLLASRGQPDVENDHVADAVARALGTTGADAADSYVMAARFSRASGRTAEVVRWLEAALEAQPSNAVAASFLLAIACEGSDPEPIQRFLRLRLEGSDVTTWIDRMRISAFALIHSGHHRGLGLRLLRQALERAYESEHTNVPGHLAMWSVLAAHAAADGTRRELLPMVITALQSSHHEVDRVWLGALATEISLRDAGHAVVAGAYAEIVAEHAPEHPIVRELVSAVAALPQAEEAQASGTPVPLAAVIVPPAAVTAARLEEAVDVDIDLDDAYAEATEASLLESDLEPDDEVDDEGAVVWAPRRRPATEVPRSGPAKPTSIPAVRATATGSGATAMTASAAAGTARPAPAAAASPSATQPSTIAGAKPASTVTSTSPSAGAPAAATKPAAPPAVASKATPSAAPNVAASTAAATNAGSNAAMSKPAASKPAPSAAPAKPSASAAATVPSSAAASPPSVTTVNAPGKIVPSFGKPSMTVSPVLAKPTSAKVTSSMTPISRLPPGGAPARPNPVLAALRTVDRPELPPRQPTPPDAAPRARRISIPIDVRLVLAGGKRVTGHSRDISTSGLFVLTDATLTVGDELRVELLLPGAEAFTEEEHRARGRVARQADGGYGIELLEPDAALIAALGAL